ncbi:MAG: TIGR01777 family protein [Chloroflexi bacterium]|nr:MAG: TIGR01777 family protein [Chloroflexota bacterium]MBL1197291.1 TIGR01777 family protein [Chloroflexota bacterium]NOH14586.1 TIGR01777 family protein [Chloroflexota bacterium]
MRVIITGGSGLIGRALTENLVGDGHEVMILSRSPEKVRGLPEGARAVAWDGRTAGGWGELADGSDVIVNLAGANLLGDGLIPQRWTQARKKIIADSRINAGKAVVDAVEAAKAKPRVVIQSSAVGYYGVQQDQKITEEHPAGDDYLAQLCIDWENSTAAVEDMGVRRGIIRTGLPLTNEGGVLPLMKLPYIFFSGGRLGSGQQYYSWLHMQDQVAAMRFLIENEKASGPFNLSAPEPLTQDEFGKVIGRVLRRPHWFPVPGFLMQLALGESAMVVLEGQRVIPEALQTAGFEFQYPELDGALQQLLSS